MLPRPRATGLLAALALCWTLPTVQAEPSASDQEACTPDVFDICSAAIPNETAIVACLNAHIPQLRPECRAVIDPPRPQPKRRSRRS